MFIKKYVKKFKLILNKVIMLLRGDIIFAYKAFDFELQDRFQNQYEFGKWYEDDYSDYMAIHKNHGYHCCVNPWDTIIYFNDIRVVKVELEEYKIQPRTGDRLDSVIIAKKMKLIEDVVLELADFHPDKINWLFVSSQLKLEPGEVIKYEKYIDFSRYKGKNRGKLFGKI